MLGIGPAAADPGRLPLLPYPGEPWQPALLMLLLGGALGLFQLPLIVGVQSTVGWSERGTTTASVLFCRQVGQSVGAALFGAVANGVLAARLGGAGDLDSVSRALDPAGAPRRPAGRSRTRSTTSTWARRARRGRVRGAAGGGAAALSGARSNHS